MFITPTYLWGGMRPDRGRIVISSCLRVSPINTRWAAVKDDALPFTLEFIVIPFRLTPLKPWLFHFLGHPRPLPRYYLARVGGQTKPTHRLRHPKKIWDRMQDHLYPSLPRLEHAYAW
jgi:hypothetical protein